MKYIIKFSGFIRDVGKTAGVMSLSMINGGLKTKKARNPVKDGQVYALRCMHVCMRTTLNIITTSL